MAKLVKVRLAKKMGERAGLHEQHRDHPGGFAAIDTQGVVYTVALTAAVSERLSRGMIELVATVADDPTPEDPAPAEPPARRKRAG